MFRRAQPADHRAEPEEIISGKASGLSKSRSITCQAVTSAGRIDPSLDRSKSFQGSTAPVLSHHTEALSSLSCLSLRSKWKLVGLFYFSLDNIDQIWRTYFLYEAFPKSHYPQFTPFFSFTTSCSHPLYIILHFLNLTSF